MMSILKEFFRQDGLPKVKGTVDQSIYITAIHCTPPGDDSPPLNDDFAAYVDAGGSGNYNSVGYVDVRNQGVAVPGEKRFYARTSDGAIVNTLYMQKDGSFSVVNDNCMLVLNANGSVEFRNDKGSAVLHPGGNVVINGVIIDKDGNISTSGKVTANNVVADSVKVNNKELANHTHNFTNADGVPSVTAGNN